jgi:hypothetical protein
MNISQHDKLTQHIHVFYESTPEALIQLSREVPRTVSMTRLFSQQFEQKAHAIRPRKLDCDLAIGPKEKNHIRLA